MTKTLEARHTPGTVELRATGDGAKIGGYALKYNKLSQNLGGFVERIATGALKKTLADGGDVLCRYQHEDRYLLGRTSSGTLRLKDDKVGLDYESDLPSTSYATDLAVLCEREDVRNSSFAFYTIEDHWEWSETDYPVRTLLEIQLVDVAPVINPAYLDTTSALRSLGERLHLDHDAVAAAVSSNQLSEMLRKAETTVIDLSTPPSERSDEGDGDQPGETHWPANHAARQALLREKSRTP